MYPQYLMGMGGCEFLKPDGYEDGYGYDFKKWVWVRVLLQLPLTSPCPSLP